MSENNMKKITDCQGLEIVETALCGCFSDTEHLDIPDGVTVVREFALMFARKLKSVYIPSSVTTIETMAFSPDVEVTVADDNPMYMQRGGLLMEKQTGRLVFAAHNASLCGNSGIKIISGHVFDSRKDITELVIPDGVTEIERGAFDCCSNMTRVRIPASVRKIEQTAFANCDAVREFEVDGGNAEYYVKNGCLTERATNTLIRACVGCVIPEGVRELGRAAFGGGHTALEFPSSLTEGFDKAFCGCYDLEKLTVSADNPVYYSMGNCIIDRTTGVLVRGCKNSVVQDGCGIVKIGDGAFSHSRGLRRIEIPHGVTEIGKFAFEACSDLVDAVFPNTLTELNLCAFSSCSSLKTVVLPESLRYIGQGAFERCSALERITIPRGVTKIVEDAFENCGSLNEIVFEDVNGWRTDGGVDVAPEELCGAAALRTLSTPQSLVKIGNE